MTTNETRTPALSVTVLTEPSGSPYGVSIEFAGVAEPLTITMGQLSADIRAYAAVHGLKQKLVDAAAISRNPDTGRSASVEDKAAAVREVAQRLLAGEWNKRRADGEGTGTGGLLFRALMRLQPAAGAEKVKEFLAARSKTEQAALRATPKVAAIIEELRAADAKTGGIDADALLGELDA